MGFKEFDNLVFAFGTRKKKGPLWLVSFVDPSLAESATESLFLAA
jgi:hypothetical protein